MIPDHGEAGRERQFSVPQLVRAAYGDYQPALFVLLRRPWARMHASYHNYVHYKRHFGDSVAGEVAWVVESVSAFRRCEANFTTDHCALSFEVLARENEETFYHCDQLIKGMYVTFLRRWRKEMARLLLLRAEEYFSAPKLVLSRALSFLGLTLPSDDAGWAPMLNEPRQVAGTRPPGGTPPIPPKMVEVLRDFYAPSLSALVDSLQAEPDAIEWRQWAAAV